MSASPENKTSEKNILFSGEKLTPEAIRLVLELVRTVKTNQFRSEPDGYWPASKLAKYLKKDTTSFTKFIYKLQDQGKVRCRRPVSNDGIQKSRGLLVNVLDYLEYDYNLKVGPSGAKYSTPLERSGGSELERIDDRKQNAREAKEEKIRQHNEKVAKKLNLQNRK